MGDHRAARGGVMVQPGGFDPFDGFDSRYSTKYSVDIHGAIRPLSCYGVKRVKRVKTSPTFISFTLKPLRCTGIEERERL